MKKTIAILVTTLLIILLGVSVVQAATATAVLNPSKTTVRPGETFTVTLKVTCPEEINGIIFKDYTYNTEKLEFVSASAGTNITDLGADTDNKVNLIAMAVGLTTSDAYVLTFKAKESITSETTDTISTTAITVDSMTGGVVTVPAISTTITIQPVSAQNPEDPGNTNAGNTNAGNTNAGNTNAGNTNAGNTNAGNTNAGNTNAGNTNAGNTYGVNTYGGNTNTGNTSYGGNVTISNITNTSNTNTNSNKTNAKTNNAESALPYTGEAGTIIALVAVIGVIVAIVAFKKIHEYRDI